MQEVSAGLKGDVILALNLSAYICLSAELKVCNYFIVCEFLFIFCRFKY